MKYFLSILLFSITFQLSAQNVQDLIDEVDQNALTTRLNEFSGEVSTIVNGATVTIRNRVSATNNNLAADYLVQELNKFPGLNVQDIAYSSGGRNIVATQLGSVNPNNIYIICGHYDAVADYCADDNVSGTAAVLEIARILSTQCVENTIVYALWDEEERGLIGANNYAQAAKSRNDNILGVLNMDMMGYDGNGDNNVDIDVRPIAQSIAMKDELLGLVTTYGSNFDFTAGTVNVVNPGTAASDHSAFWNQGYSALLLGESWETGDQTPEYHSFRDRVATLDIDYYHDLVKLVMAYTATKANISLIDSNVTENTDILTVAQTGASYQWINCSTGMAIPGATSQSYLVATLGEYAVDVTLGGCTERSKCINVTTLGTDDLDSSKFEFFPNPATSVLNVNLTQFKTASLAIIDMTGKTVLSSEVKKKENSLDLSSLSAGVYFLRVGLDGKEATSKLVLRK